MRKFNEFELILHTTMWIIFMQCAPAYGDLHLLFVRESEYFIEFLCNCWFFLIQIIILTLRKIKRFQWLPFLWARLICVLPCILSERLTYSLDFFRATFKILTQMSRDRMDHTAAGICYSYRISQVLLKVAIKFKNANLILNVIVEHLS